MTESLPQRVLVISTHPDDETLGCGGTLLKHHNAGDLLYWLVVTKPDEDQYHGDFVTRAGVQVENVAHRYEMENVFKLGFPTARLDTISQKDLMAELFGAIKETHPSTVYLVHAGDVHSDHVAIFSAALAVLKPFHMKSLGVRRILSYETLSSTDAAPPHSLPAFVPTVFTDITPYMEQKLEIMALYGTEAQADYYPRDASSIRALARYRGATIGVQYAEAFMLLRELN